MDESRIIQELSRDGWQIKEELNYLGWPDRFLRWNKREARIDLNEDGDMNGFVPWKRKDRISQPEAFLPVDQVIYKGIEIAFSENYPIYAERFVGAYEPTYEGSGKIFEGSTVKSRGFPTLRWLTVEDVGLYDFIVLGKNYWKVPNRELTYITQIIIRFTHEHIFNHSIMYHPEKLLD